MTVTPEQAEKALQAFKDTMWRDGEIPAMQAAIESALASRAQSGETPAPPPQTHVVGVDIPRLPVGTPITKVLGYPFPGTIVAAFHTLSGQERFVVEATGEGYRGMLHIFNGDQLRATATEGQP